MSIEFLEHRVIVVDILVLCEKWTVSQNYFELGVVSIDKQHEDSLNQTFLLECDGKYSVGVCCNVFESDTPVIRIGSLFAENSHFQDDTMIVLHPNSNIPSLSTVVLAPTDKLALAFSDKTPDFTTLFLSLYTHRKTHVCLPQIHSSLPFTWYVANTTPFGCGLITLETRIYVLSDFKDFHQIGLNPTPLPFPFTSNFIKKESKSTNLKVYFLEELALEHVFHAKGYNMHQIGIVSHSTLLSLGFAFVESWVDITYQNTKRHIQIVSLSESMEREAHIEKDSIYISREFCFNFGIDLSPCVLSSTPLEITLSPSDFEPTNASNLALSSIKSPDMPFEYVMESLGFYFETPRHLVVGDVFGVDNITQFKSFVLKRDPSHSKFYFKVDSISGDVVDGKCVIGPIGEVVSKLPIECPNFPSLFETTPWRQVEHYLITLLQMLFPSVQSPCVKLLDFI
jgi:hypothetical protein